MMGVVGIDLLVFMGVILADCLEELVRFVLSSFLDGTLDLDLGISRDYCARLLQEEAAVDDLRSVRETCENVPDDLRGVPSRPLYKRLALLLGRCLIYESFSRTSESVIGMAEVEFKDKELDWSNLFKASDLAKMYDHAHFEMHVQEPFFSQLRSGEKTVEGRCALGKYTQIKEDDLLIINKHLLLRVENERGGYDCLDDVNTRMLNTIYLDHGLSDPPPWMQNIKHYPSFFAMLDAETLDKVLPGIKTIEEGVQIYRKFYSEEIEMSNGVLAIYVSRPAYQPCNAMSALLSGLGYEGIGRLLGMAHTTGTIPEALPPPISSLLSSFMHHHQPDAKVSALTEGARALSKHVSRSSGGWWAQKLTGNAEGLR
ncbi:uncharacterized protein LOC144705762 [Wolffia australiana]